MKKGWYFCHELECMSIAYAIVPAVVFILVCGLLSMTMPLHGKKSGSIEHNQYVAGLLDSVLVWCEDDVEEVASQPGLLGKVRDQDGRVGLSRIFYGVISSLGLEGDLFVMDNSRNILLSSCSDLPPSLNVLEGVSQGIFDDIDREPNRTALKLAEGWKNGDSTIVIGRNVMDGNRKQGYTLCSTPNSQFKAFVDKPDVQTTITDSFGWAYVSSNYSLLNSNNQVTKILMGSDRYSSHKKRMYLVSRQRVPRGGSTAYSISDTQNIVISPGLGSGSVVAAPVLMTLWMLLNSKKVTEIKTEDFYKTLDVMESAGGGGLEGVVRIRSDDEFKIIASAYNEIIQSLRIQMEDNRKMVELVSMVQNKQLESQFNPHFLHNTLENIRYICKLEPATVERMVFSLSNLLHHGLNDSKAEVTSKEDLEHLESYLTILKCRLGERFQCRIDVEPETMDLRTPRLVFQSMIENAAKYGFRKQFNLTMELRAYIHEGRSIAICRNDGVGIPQCTLSEPTALLEQKENLRGHSGLYNIHRRTGILYGRPYGVEIRSVKGYSTTLVVALPVKREESDGCYAY